MLAIRAGTHKCLSEEQTEKILVRLLLQIQKQSDLGLRCLTRTLGQAPSVRILRLSTILFYQIAVKE